jgi:hypothetical protein
MKTIEALGSVGITLFFGNVPNKFAMVPETCGGITMPVTVSSLDYYHFRKDNAGNKLPGPSLVLGALIAFKKKSPFLLSIPVDEVNYKPYVAAGYAVGVVCAVLCMANAGLAFVSLKRIGVKMNSLTRELRALFVL